MKKTTLVKISMFISCVLLIMQCVSVFSAGTNILPLEEYGWEEFTSTGTNSPSTNRFAQFETEASGNRMLRIAYNASYQNNVWWRIAAPLSSQVATSGQYAIVRFKLKNNLTTSYKTTVHIGNESQNYVRLDGEVSGSYPEGRVIEEFLEDGWIKYTVRVSGWNGMSKLYIQITGKIDISMDDFSVVRENGDGTEYMINGGFDALLFNPKKLFAEDWERKNGSSVPFNNTNFVQLDNMVAYTGNNSLFFLYKGTNNSNEYVAAEQEINHLVAGKTYTVSFYIKTNESAANVRFGFVGETSFTYEDILVPPTGSSSGSWVRYEENITPKAGETAFRIAVFSALGGLWIDDVSVTDGEGTEMVSNGSFEVLEQLPDFQVGEFLLTKNDVISESLTAGTYNIQIDVENNYLSESVNTMLIVTVNEGIKTLSCYNTSLVLEPTGDLINPSLLELEVTVDTVTPNTYLEVFLWDSENMMRLKPFKVFK